MSVAFNPAQAASIKAESAINPFPYEIIKTLGSGDQADVFLLKNAEGEVFAGKCFHPKSRFEDAGFPIEYIESVYPDGKNIFAQKELEISNKLQPCEHIAKAYDVIYDEKDGKLVTWLIEEFIDGKTISQIELPLSFPRYMSIFSQLISALKKGFEAGFFHEDLHDSNMLIDSYGNLKLIDIGSFSEIDDCDELTQGDILDHIKHESSMFAMLSDQSESVKKLQDDIAKILENRDGHDKKMHKNSHIEFFIPIMNELEALLKGK